MVWAPRPQSGPLRMVSVDAIGSEPYPREQEIILQACFRPHVDSNEDPEFDVSWLYLHGPNVEIDFAEQAVAVFLRGNCEMRDERLDHLPLGLLERWRPADARRLRLAHPALEL